GGSRVARFYNPALTAKAGRVAHDPGGLMAATAPVDRGSGVPARLPAENDKPLAPARAATAAPKREPRPEPHRWMREARGILAIVVAGFAIVSLAVFDPALLPTDQGSPVGPVGWWLGWALFRALGYAGF